MFKKNSMFLIVLLVISQLSALSSSSAPSGCLTVVRTEDKMVWTSQICGDSSKIKLDLGVQNVQLEVEQTIAAVFFEEENFRGKTTLLTQDNKSFSIPVARSVLFGKIGCTYKYQRCGFSGQRTELCNSIDHEINLLKDISNQEAFIGETINIDTGVISRCQEESSPTSFLQLSTDVNENCVRFYEHINYEGSHQDICEDTPYIGDALHDKYSSVKLGNNVNAIMFQHIQYYGKYEYIEEDIDNFVSIQWNDIVSSVIVVKKGCVNLYKHCNFQGDKVEFCASTPTIAVLDDQFSAYVTGSNDWSLFCSPNYQGCSLEASKYSLDNCLINEGFNDMISSVRKIIDVPQPGCARFFELLDYEGNFEDVCGDVASFSQEHFDTYSSIILGRRTNVVLFASTNFGGNSQYISKNTRNLLLEGWSVQAKSLLIVDRWCISLYSECNFLGVKKVICRNTSELTDLDNHFSSYISGNQDWVLWSEHNYQGDSLQVEQKDFDNCLIDENFDNLTSSVMRLGNGVRPGCIRFYVSENYQGDWQDVCEDTNSILIHDCPTTINSNSFINTSSFGPSSPFDFSFLIPTPVVFPTPSVTTNYKSAQLGPGASMVIFEFIDFIGQRMYIENNVPNFDSIDWNLPLSSVVVVNKNCISLYEHCDFKGTKKTYCSNTPNLLDFNGKASSYVVGNHPFSIHQLEFYGGQLIEADPKEIHECLFEINLDNFARSVKKNWKHVPRGCARFYEQCNFQGAFQDICEDTPVVLSTLNDKFSSVRLGRHASVVIFEHNNYGGKYTYISTNSKSLVNQGFNDQISSVLINDNRCISVYEHCDFQGQKVVYCKNTPEITALLGKASAYVTGNRKVILYDDGYFVGNSIHAERQSIDKCLISRSFNDKTISLQFLPYGIAPGCVRFFVECDYKGEYQDICQDTPCVANNFNDKFSSARVGPDTNFVIFEHVNYAGKSRYVNTHIPSFVSIELNDQVSSVLVVNKGCISVYEHCNYQGQKVQYCDNNRSIASLNEKISAYVTGNHDWSLYEDEDFAGESKEVEKNTFDNCLVDDDFNDVITSLKRHHNGLRNGCIRIYEHVNFNGDFEDYCEDTIQISSTLASKVSSIKLGASTAAVIFNQANYLGDYYFVHNHERSLFDQNWNDELVSILIINKNCVNLYENCGFQGQKVTYCNSQRKIGVLNNKFSSYIIGHNDWELFDQIDFLGNELEANKFTLDTCLTNDSFGDKIFSVRRKYMGVSEGCARFFEYINYKGAFVEVCGDTNFIGNFNDRVSSIQLGKSTNVVIFEHASYNGKSRYIDRNTRNLFIEGWNDKLSSVLFTKTNCISLYQNCNFQGQKVEYCKNTPLLAVEHDNNFSSYLTGNFDWSLFSLDNYLGENIVAPKKSFDSCLINEGFNDETSSILSHGNGIRPGCVRFYEHTEFKGNFKEVCEDTANIGSASNDTFSSVRVGGLGHATIFEHLNYEGKSLFIDRHIPDLGHFEWNNIISSVLIVDKRCIALYEHCNFQGRKLTFCNNDPSIAQLNNHISAYHAGSFEWSLFADAHYQGNSIEVSRQTFDKCLVNNNFNDVVSSVKKGWNSLASGCVRFYEHINFKGRVQLVCNDAPYIGSDFNDSFKSVRLGGSTSVLLFEHNNFSGQNVLVDKTTSDIASLNWSGIVNSVITIDTRCISMYEHCNFGGQKVLFCKNTTSFTLLNNQFSAFVSGSRKWTLYADPNFQGASLIADKQSFDPCFIDDHFNDITSSIKRN